MSVIPKLVHLLAKEMGARWVWSKGRRYLVYMKLDLVKIACIVKQKEAGVRVRDIASAIGVSERRVQKLWSSYSTTGVVPSLGRPGRRCVTTSGEETLIMERAHARYRPAVGLLRQLVTDSAEGR